jgi:hypothetical protein
VAVLTEQLSLDLATAISSNGHEPTEAELFHEEAAVSVLARYTEDDVDTLLAALTGWQRDRRPAESARPKPCGCLTGPLLLDGGPECARCGRSPPP